VQQGGLHAGGLDQKRLEGDDEVRVSVVRCFGTVEALI
jgi:hypothetical protein